MSFARKRYQSSAPRVDLELIVWSLALAFILFLDPHATGWSFCPRSWFDLWCPGCGVTRAMAAIMNFEYGLAWSLNPIAFFVMPVIGFRWLTLLIRSSRPCHTMPSWTR